MEDIPGYRHLLALDRFQDGNITHAIPLYTELYLEESQGISTKAAQPGTVLDFDKVNTDMVKALRQAAAESQVRSFWVPALQLQTEQKRKTHGQNIR